MGLIHEFESQYWAKDTLVLGLDEAGRGPMAGPCVVAGVVFPKGYDHPLINDSKQLSDKKRRALSEIIYRDALCTYIEIIDAKTIDQKNIYQVVKEAMMKISIQSDVSVVLSDAMPFEINDKVVVSIVKGDSRSISIAAASILAKTLRDDFMLELDAMYPEYGFKDHKGYGTQKHKEAILKYGRCDAHRKTFRFKDEAQLSLDI